MKPERAEWASIGAHRYRFEAPDIFISEMHGEVTVDQQRQLCDVVKAHAVRQGAKIFWVSNVRDIGTMTPEARKYAAKVDLRDEVAGTVLVGASFQLRIVINLITTAAGILQQQRTSVAPIHCVETEAEARAQIEKLRGKR